MSLSTAKNVVIVIPVNTPPTKPTIQNAHLIHYAKQKPNIKLAISEEIIMAQVTPSDGLPC